MRLGSKTDFTVEVQGIGNFTFGRRTMKDEIKIQVEYARIIEGVEPTEWLQSVGGWLAAFKVLTVRAPEGWDIDEMDPLDQETYTRMALVYAALREKERSFRSGSQQTGEVERSGTVENGGVLVPQEIRTDTE